MDYLRIELDLLYKKKISMNFYETVSRDSANCFDHGISLRNRNPCYQRISCDSFKYGMSQSSTLVSYWTKMVILFLHWSRISIFGKYHDHPIRRVSIFSNERFEDLLVLTADCRVDHSDLSIHRYGFRTYEWEYSRNSQRKKEVS